MSTLPQLQAATALQVSVGGYSTAGRKAENQDAFAAHQPSGGAERHFKGVAACLADGASCSREAQQASQISVINFLEDYYSTPETWDVKTAATRVFRSLNAWLHHHDRHLNTGHDGLLTTFSAIVMKGATAHCFHVGDSRIYRLRGGELQQLSRDHTHGSGAQRRLVRALGLDSHLDMDYQALSLAEGDLWLLTSDGLHEHLDNRVMAAQLASAGDNLESSAKQLVDLAYDNGSQDNISCLLLRINQLPRQDLDDYHRRLTALALPPPLTPGQCIDHFRVLKVLHSGSRSHLYLVEDSHNNERLVLKAPSANFAEDPQYLDAFIQEQWVGSRFNHPNLLKTYPRPESSRLLYHLCDYIDGITLRQWMHDHPTPSLAQIRAIAKQVIAGLRALQRQGMVHRDLKPDNILLTRDDRVVLIDFGTVQVAGLGDIRLSDPTAPPPGALDYLAPEYLLGDSGSARADQFSLAVILYEMATGALPYNTSLARHQPQHYRLGDYISARQRREDIPLWFDLALKRGCHLTVNGRYPAFSELLADLTTPNALLVGQFRQSPLLTRQPLRFWKGLCVLLCLLILLQWGVMLH